MNIFCLELLFDKVYLLEIFDTTQNLDLNNLTLQNVICIKLYTYMKCRYKYLENEQCII